MHLACSKYKRRIISNYSLNMVLSRNSEYPNRKAEYCCGAWGWLMFRSLGKQVLISYSLSLGSRRFTRRRIRRKVLMPQKGNSKKMQEKTEALGIFCEWEIEPGQGNEYLLGMEDTGSWT